MPSEPSTTTTSATTSGRSGEEARAAGIAAAPQAFLHYSARAWHFLRKQPRSVQARDVAKAIYPSVGSEYDQRRAAHAILMYLERRGLAERGDSVSGFIGWIALRTVAQADDLAVFGAVTPNTENLTTIARRVGLSERETYASLARLSTPGMVASSHSRTRGALWCRETEPFPPSLEFFSGAAVASQAPMVQLEVEARTTVPIVPSVARSGEPTTAPKFVNRKDAMVHPLVFAALPPPQAQPISAETVAARAYGSNQSAGRFRAVQDALRSLHALGIVTGSTHTNQWVQRVRGPSEDDEVVLAALDDSLRAQHDVIASVWPEATADQATAVVDSLRRLRVFGFAERVPSGHGPMRWRRKAVR